MKIFKKRNTKILLWEVFVLGGFCPGGFCQGNMSGAFLSGGFVLELPPVANEGGGRGCHPKGFSCFSPQW